MPTKRLVVTKELVASCIPDAPKGYRHTIVKVSPTVYRVILWHPDHHFSSRTNVYSDWGYVKGRKVFTPKGGKPSKVEVCDLLDAGELSGYTSVIPTPNDLFPPLK